MRLPRLLTAARLAAATLCSLGAALTFVYNLRGAPRALVIPVALLASAAVLVHLKSAGAQLVARAAWWSNLLLGVLLAISGGQQERSMGGWLAILLGLALLLAGRRRLEGGTGRFAPEVHRAALTSLIVLALADAQCMALFGSIDGVRSPVLLAGAGLFLVAALGIYLLKVWGLALVAVASLTSAALMMLGRLAVASALPFPARVALVATALLQVLLVVPVLRSLRRGVAPATPRLARAAVLLTSLLILALIGLAVVGAFVARAALVTAW